MIPQNVKAYLAQFGTLEDVAGMTLVTSRRVAQWIAANQIPDFQLAKLEKIFAESGGNPEPKTRYCSSCMTKRPTEGGHFIHNHIRRWMCEKCYSFRIKRIQKIRKKGQHEKNEQSDHQHHRKDTKNTTKT